jgi:hypothetical protein
LEDPGVYKARTQKKLNLADGSWVLIRYFRLPRWHFWLYSLIPFFPFIAQSIILSPKRLLIGHPHFPSHPLPPLPLITMVHQQLHLVGVVTGLSMNRRQEDDASRGEWLLKSIRQGLFQFFALIWNRTW